MNLGGVGGLYSTSDNLYLGSNGLHGYLVVENLVKLGLDPSISLLLKLYSGLFNPIITMSVKNTYLNFVTYLYVMHVGMIYQYPNFNFKILLY